MTRASLLLLPLPLPLLAEERAKKVLSAWKGRDHRRLVHRSSRESSSSLSLLPMIPPRARPSPPSPSPTTRLRRRLFRCPLRRPDPTSLAPGADPSSPAEGPPSSPWEPRSSSSPSGSASSLNRRCRWSMGPRRRMSRRRSGLSCSSSTPSRAVDSYGSSGM